MKLKVKKAFGKLKAGDYHKTETDEQGQHLIEKGLATDASDDDNFPAEKDVESKPAPTVSTTGGVTKEKKK